MSLDLDALRARLVHEEGIARRREDKPGRLFPYRDSRGIETIGVGRNLQDKGISEAEAMVLLENDIAEHLALLDKYLPWWREMNDVRQLVLADLAFNMGVGPTAEHPNGKLLTFKNTLGHMERGEYARAASGLASSVWAKQVGTRSDPLVAMMGSGRMPA